MKSRRIVFALFTIATALLPATAAAQQWNQPWSDPRDRPPRVDLSLSAGMVAPSDWSDLVLLGTLSPASGVFEQVLVRDIRVEPDRVFAGAVTYWRDRFGLRAEASLARSSITVGGAAFDDHAGREVLSSNVNTWFYDVRGTIGLVKYSPTRKVWPYAFVGLGGITYDLGRTISPPLLTFIERGRSGSNGADLVIVDDDGHEFLLAVDELSLETVPALSFGAGTDFRLPVGGGGLGLRIEVSDHLSSSPLGLRIRELNSFGGLTRDDAVHFRTVHHLRAEAGLVVQIGR